MAKSIDNKSGTVKLSLEYTSFTGLRLPFIGPSPLIVNVVNQKTFEVPVGGRFKKGYGLRLWDEITGNYTSDPVNYIFSVVGNIVTMESDFTTTLSQNIRIKLCDYSDASSEQKGRYAYIGSNSQIFSDGTSLYSILF